ncbi:TraB/GumN family protein [Glacieibacterium frigidum]|nr:TraB/GumN family protein [Glacieibacterium frigidum]
MRIVALALLLAASPVAAEPAIWVVRDADTEITLFGTLHELPTGIDWLTPRIAARVDAADTLVLETVIPEDRDAIGTLVTTLGYSPKLPPLAKRIAPRLQAPLAAVLRDTRLQPAALDGMETWLAAVTLGDAVLAKLGLDETNGVEAVLTARVRAARKPVTGLETPAEQLGYFDTLPETDQRALLDATVADTATAAADTNRLIASWTSGNTQVIADGFRDSLRATPRLAQVLLVDRNARWATWIAARLAQPGKVFVAVGAAHLAGTDSVQAKLAAQGITAERLR